MQGHSPLVPDGLCGRRYCRFVDGSPCSVLHCERAAVHPVLPTLGTPGAGVCSEHLAEIDSTMWVHRDGAILLAGDLGTLLQADRVTMAIDKSFSPGLGTFSSLTVDGRTVTSGEPQTVEVVLTDDVVRQLAKLVWMYHRTR